MNPAGTSSSSGSSSNSGTTSSNSQDKTKACHYGFLGTSFPDMPLEDERRQEDGDSDYSVGLSLDEESDETRPQQQDSSSVSSSTPTTDETVDSAPRADDPNEACESFSATTDARRSVRRKLRLRISKSLTSLIIPSSKQLSGATTCGEHIECTPYPLQAASVTMPKSVLRKSSSYGCLLPCCQIIPIHTKSKAWKQLPAPKSVPCFHKVVDQDLLKQHHPEDHSPAAKKVPSSLTSPFALLFAVKTCNPSRQLKQVSWSNVNIREHALTVGDNPSCEVGTPLSLDWYYQQQPAVPIDYFEKSRTLNGGRRHYKELKLPPVRRHELLLKYNVTPEEMEKADAIKDKVRRQREKTMEFSLFVPTVMEIMVESAIRKVRRSVACVRSRSSR
jgi:hypothetical protein